MNKAIKWFKGTITGKNLYSKGNEGYKDFEVALRIAKKEVFDDIENLSRPLAGDFGKTPIYKEYQELKKKHLGNKK